MQKIRLISHNFIFQEIDECILSLQPVKSQMEDVVVPSNLYRCPYCPNSFNNNMSLNLLKLHVKKVHRISCVDNFTCPKCLQAVFDSPAESVDGYKEDQNVIKDSGDQNMINQGIIIDIKLLICMIMIFFISWV